jgi:hypothetical protein
MKYKVGDIVRVKSIEELQEEGAIIKGLSIEESIEFINEKKGKHNLNFIEYESLWSLYLPEFTDQEFTFDHLYYINQEALILNVIVDKLSFGDRVLLELENDLVLNPNFTHYQLSIDNTGNIWCDWMLNLVKAR